MVQIRLARLDDLSVVQEIENSCFTTDIITPRQMHYLLTQAKAQFWVAELQQQLVAYAVLLTPKSLRLARIYSLAVRAEARGRGIAKQLILTMQHHAKKQGYAKISLEVQLRQPKVVALYQKSGFAIVDTIKHYYEDGSDAYKMEHAL